MANKANEFKNVTDSLFNIAGEIEAVVEVMEDNQGSSLWGYIAKRLSRIAVELGETHEELAEKIEQMGGK